MADATLDLVQLEETPEGVTREAARHALLFDGLVTPHGEGLGATLAFRLIGGTPEGATEPGTNLSGRWVPAQQKLVLEVERVDLGSPLGMLMPPEARRTWRELDPAGDLPSLTLETRLDRAGTEALQRAELEVENLSFRLPLAKQGLLPEGESQEDAPRMTGVTGTVAVEDGRLTSEGLVGEIEGIRYRISGETSIDGRGDFTLVAQTEAFDVPASPPLLFRLPGPISKTYDEYKPSGRFSRAWRSSGGRASRCGWTGGCGSSTPGRSSTTSRTRWSTSRAMSSFRATGSSCGTSPARDPTAAG